MKKVLTIGSAAATMVAAWSLIAFGGPQGGPAAASAEARPASEILNIVRRNGLNPSGEPVRRGPYYVLHAYDTGGVEVRVVADAQLGDIVSVAPIAAMNVVYAPSYERGPRIIHVPQPDDADARVSLRDNESVYSGEEDDDVTALPPRPARKPIRNVTPKPHAKAEPPQPAPRWKLRSDAPPPPPPSGPRRAILSAPPPSVDGPTPIRPTPRFGAKALPPAQSDPADKFVPPRSTAAISPEPPAPLGYVPPAGPAPADTTSDQ